MKNTLEPLGLGDKITELKNQIRFVQNELSLIKHPAKSSPELIDSTNLLRENEYLTTVNANQEKLLDLYQQYVSELEKTFSMIFEIQNELKDLIKEHAKDIAKPKKTRRIKKRSTTKKTTAKKSKSRPTAKRTKTRRKK